MKPKHQQLVHSTMQIAIKPRPISMKFFRCLSVRYRDHNMTHSIKYVKRHTPSEISLNGFWKRFWWEREEEKSSHSPVPSTTDTFIIVVPFSQIINFVLSRAADMNLCVRLLIVALISFLLVHSLDSARLCTFHACFWSRILILHVCAEFFSDLKHVQPFLISFAVALLFAG